MVQDSSIQHSNEMKSQTATDPDQAREALRKSEDPHPSLILAQGVLNSLSAQIAVLDEQGTIIAVNRAWKQFGKKNDWPDERCHIGWNYLKVCQQSAEQDKDETARAVLNGMQRVLQGDPDQFALEYPCPSPRKEYWFILRVTSFLEGGVKRLVVAHEDITDRKEAEAALKQALETARLREKETAALLSGAHAVLKYKEFEDASGALFRVIKEQIGAKAGFVGIFSENGEKTEYILFDSGKGYRVEPVLKIPTHFFYRQETADTGNAICENDFAHSKWASILPSGHMKIENILISRVKVDGELVGMLALANKPGGFSEEDLRLATGFGELAGVSFRNSRTLNALNELNRDLEWRVEERTEALFKANSELEKALQAKAKTLEVLQESQERFAAFMDHLPGIAFMKEPAGQFFFANRYSWEHFEAGKEWIGKTSQEIFPKDLADEKEKDDLRLHSGSLQTELVLRDVMNTERVFDLHKFLIKSPGRPDLVGGIAMDVTEKMEYERRLHENQAMLRSVFNGISDPLILMDPDMRVKMINEAAESYYGYDGAFDQDQLLKPCHEIFNRNQFCESCQVREAVLKREYVVFERKGHADPEKMERVYIYPVLDARKKTGDLIVRIHDITEEVRMQEEMLHSEKMISLGTLVAGVAHEINNPNNFIMINIALLSDIWNGITPILDEYFVESGEDKIAGLTYSEIKKEVPGLFTAAEEGAKRIKNIVQELKEFSTKENILNFAEIEANTPLRKAVSLLSHEIRKKTRFFKITYGKNLPKIQGSLQGLEQVFLNIIQNGLEALPDPSRKVSVKSGFDTAKDRVVFEFRDEGVGIPEEMLPRIMDPFFTTKRSKGGTGLGLAVCDKIIKRHKGTIEVQSEPERGSVFRVLLPPVEQV